jgi:hypothetical protein
LNDLMVAVSTQDEVINHVDAVLNLILGALLCHVLVADLHRHY